MTESNAKAGFRGAGLVPHNPDATLSKLDIKLRTPTPTLPGQNEDIWTSLTPRNHKEALSQSKHVIDQIIKHKSSSPTPILSASNSMAKGMALIAHGYALLEEENRTLREANQRLSKRRKAKKAHTTWRTLAIQHAINIVGSYETNTPLQRDSAHNNGAGSSGRRGASRCSQCNNIGHNSRTCQNDTIVVASSHPE